MKLRILVFSILLIALSGCIEIIDDLSLNKDGSGTFRYTVNLSSSKVKINSILALDSLDGKKVPTIAEISGKVNKVVDQLKTQEGISDITFDSDYDNFIFKLKFDFSSLPELQGAIRSIVLSENGNKNIPELEQPWLTYAEYKLVRSIPQITVKKAKEINSTDRDLLKNGTYTSITRFASEVEKYSNELGVLSKNKKAVMVRTDPFSLTQNPNLLDNSIYLTESAQ